MVLYRRNFVPGGVYFFTVTIQNRASWMLVENIELLKNSIHQVKQKYPFLMKAYVILPDHIHAIWELPEGDKDYSLRWKRIKAHFSKSVHKKGVFLGKTKHNEYRLWQRRFWEHTIRDAQDYENHMNYIHYNPIKHGLVNHLKDWPYSSFHYYVRNGKLSANWAVEERGDCYGE